MKFADKILMLRKSRGMSQEELAEKLNVSRQAISRWEMGTAQPDVQNVLQISKLFGVTADYLINDEYESDEEIPCVKELRTHFNEKITKSGRDFRVIGCLWMIAAFCFLMAFIEGNDYAIICVFIDIVLAFKCFYNYRRMHSN
ncbi:MAG: helix-turn-helix transcriptional regulator [Lachnospiraceae bacterium]|nr:helix-turn-helix transcriptional regulator [Lachnospiraceae bacterium]